MISKDTLVVASPAQNRPGFESKLERLVPLLAARQINSINGVEESVEPWNNIGAKMDDAYREEDTAESRSEFSERLIEERYRLLGSLGLSANHLGVSVLCDDSPEYSSWLSEEINDAAERGTIYPDDEKMIVCDYCEKSLGVDTGSTSNIRCGSCDSADHHSEVRESFFMNIDKEPPSILLPRKSKHIQSHAKNTPDRVWVERPRGYGLGLDFTDGDYKLDPKIGISLMPEYIASVMDKRDIVMVQGKDTLYNTAPYTQTLSPDTDVRYILPANIPKGVDSEWVKEYGRNFTAKYLPLFLIDRTTDVSADQINDIKREYDTIMAHLEKMKQSPDAEALNVDIIHKLESEVSEAMDLFNKMQVRNSIINLRKRAIKTIGENKLHTSSDAKVRELLQKVQQIYGEF